MSLPQAQSDSSSLPHDQPSFSVEPPSPSLATINSPATCPPFKATILPIPHHHHPCGTTLHFCRGCKAFQTLLCCHSMFSFTLTTHLFNSQCPITIPGVLTGRPVKGATPKVLFTSASCSWDSTWSQLCQSLSCSFVQQCECRDPLPECRTLASPSHSSLLWPHPPSRQLSLPSPCLPLFSAACPV